MHNPFTKSFVVIRRLSCGHRLQAIPTYKVQRLAGAGYAVTAGADIAIIMIWLCTRTTYAAIGGGISAGNAYSVKVVAV